MDSIRDTEGVAAYIEGLDAPGVSFDADRLVAAMALADATGQCTRETPFKKMWTENRADGVWFTCAHPKPHDTRAL